MSMTVKRFVEQAETDDRQILLSELTVQYGDLRGADLLRVIIEGPFKGSVALVSSFGAEAVVLLDLMAKVDPNTPVIFLDTGKLFGETLRYRDKLRKRLGLTNILTIEPRPEEITAEDSLGLLWHHNSNDCCALRKTRPLNAALEPFQAWITGRKRFQASTRASLQPIEYAAGKFKINPLVDWSPADLEAHVVANNLPRHPLVADGCLSIGCMPCTSRVMPGADPRSGRWAGMSKVECGIHIGEHI